VRFEESRCGEKPAFVMWKRHQRQEFLGFCHMLVCASRKAEFKCTFRPETGERCREAARRLSKSENSRAYLPRRLWCPHFLHHFSAALASNPVAVGSQQATGSDDFHLLDTFFWGFVFLFKTSQGRPCVRNTGRVRTRK